MTWKLNQHGGNFLVSTSCFGVCLPELVHFPKSKKSPTGLHFYQVCFDPIHSCMPYVHMWDQNPQSSSCAKIHSNVQAKGGFKSSGYFTVTVSQCEIPSQRQGPGKHKKTETSRHTYLFYNSDCWILNPHRSIIFCTERWLWILLILLIWA